MKKSRNYGSEKRRVLEVSQQGLLEDFLKKEGSYHHWSNFFTVMLWTGMRVGEVTGLQWSDVDFENEMIHANRTLVYYDRGGEQRCGYSIHTPKARRKDYLERRENNDTSGM